jgi:hypothetical protein
LSRFRCKQLPPAISTLLPLLLLLLLSLFPRCAV